MLKTVEGAELTFQKGRQALDLDAKGDTAQVTIAQRDAVERRHPRDRHRAVAGLSSPTAPATNGPPPFAGGLFFANLGYRVVNPPLTISWANIAQG